MFDLFWLTDAQMARLEPFFPKSHGKPRVDDRRVLSGIIFINRNCLRWRDAPAPYGPHKTLYNRWKRWSDKGVFARIMAGLAAEHGERKTVMIDATYKRRNRIEIMFGRLKDWRRVATRYDRCPKVFLSAIALAATVIYWL
ncbi:MULTISPECIES: transposase [Celeribacter]|uniref:transposase n=1 Tax=Celeribacter TaxID=875170 RepID=UPI003A8F8DEC